MISRKIDNTLANRLTLLLRDNKLDDVLTELSKLEKCFETSLQIDAINLQSNTVLKEVFTKLIPLEDSLVNSAGYGPIYKLVCIMNQLLALGANINHPKFPLIHMLFQTHYEKSIINILNNYGDKVDFAQKDQANNNCIEYLISANYQKKPLNKATESLAKLLITRKVPISLQFIIDKKINTSTASLLVRALIESNYFQQRFVALKISKIYTIRLPSGEFTDRNFLKMQNISLRDYIITEKLFMHDADALIILRELLSDRDISNDTFFKSLRLSSFEEYQKIDDGVTWESLYDNHKEFGHDFFPKDLDPRFDKVMHSFFAESRPNNDVNQIYSYLKHKKGQLSQIDILSVSNRRSKTYPTLIRLILNAHETNQNSNLNQLNLLHKLSDNNYGGPLNTCIAILGATKNKSIFNNVNTVGDILRLLNQHQSISSILEKAYSQLLIDFLFFVINKVLTNKKLNIVLTDTQQSTLNDLMKDNSFYLAEQEKNKTSLSIEIAAPSAPPASTGATALPSCAITRSNSKENLNQLTLSAAALVTAVTKTSNLYPELPPNTVTNPHEAITQHVEELASSDTSTNTTPSPENNEQSHLLPVAKNVASLGLFAENNSQPSLNAEQRSIDTAVKEVIRISREQAQIRQDIQAACNALENKKVGALGRELEALELEKINWIKVANLGPTSTPVKDEVKTRPRSNSSYK